MLCMIFARFVYLQKPTNEFSKKNKEKRHTIGLIIIYGQSITCRQNIVLLGKISDTDPESTVFESLLDASYLNLVRRLRHLSFYINDKHNLRNVFFSDTSAVDFYSSFVHIINHHHQQQDMLIQ